MANILELYPEFWEKRDDSEHFRTFGTFAGDTDTVASTAVNGHRLVV